MVCLDEWLSGAAVPFLILFKFLIVPNMTEFLEFHDVFKVNCTIPSTCLVVDDSYLPHNGVQEVSRYESSKKKKKDRWTTPSEFLVTIRISDITPLFHHLNYSRYHTIQKLDIKSGITNPGDDTLFAELVVLYLHDWATCTLLQIFLIDDLNTLQIIGNRRDRNTYYKWIRIHWAWRHIILLYSNILID